MVCYTFTLVTVTVVVLGQTHDSSLDRIVKDLTKMIDERETELRRTNLENGIFDNDQNLKTRNLLDSSGKSSADVNDAAVPNNDNAKPGDIIETFRAFLTRKYGDHHKHQSPLTSWKYHPSPHQMEVFLDDKEESEDPMKHKGDKEAEIQQLKMLSIREERDLTDPQKQKSQSALPYPSGQTIPPYESVQVQTSQPIAKYKDDDSVTESLSIPHQVDNPQAVPHKEDHKAEGFEQSGSDKASSQQTDNYQADPSLASNHHHPETPGLSHPSQAFLSPPVSLPVRKRAGIHDLPQGHGMFLVLGLCLAMCSTVALVGVMFFLTRSHQEATVVNSPYTDISPSFQTSKLTFSSSSPGERNRTDQFRPAGDWGGPSASTSSFGQLAMDSGAGAGPGQNTHWSPKCKGSLIDMGPEEDDESDLIYECPGLAPHGEMEVTNPFFLSKELHHLTRPEVKQVAPCPVNNNNNIRHGSIKRNILDEFQ